MKYFFAFITITLGLISCDDNQTAQADDPVVLPPVDIQLDTLLTNLVNPWGLDFLPGGEILYTQRSGSMWLFKNGSSTEVTGLPPIESVGQGGLMDVRIDPGFDSNNWVFYSATNSEGGVYSTALYRGELSGTSLINVQKLFQAEPMNTSGFHFGSRIEFDESGHIYLSLGERNDKQSAQNPNNHNGTVVRLNKDGSIPSDNPYFNDDFAADEVFTYGHRNPQGMARNPADGSIWVHEHGPKGGDEVNILEIGANYGWPIATYGIDYDGSIISNDTFVEGTVLPIHYWVPSIAPCGMAFYWSDSIPQWKGDVFLGALAGKHLNRLEVNGSEVTDEERLLEGMARFRAVRQGPDGYLYFLTEGPGLLCRFRPQP
jgi:glucose/arabinose dehydrogenase